MRQLDKISNFISTYKIMSKHLFDDGHAQAYLWIVLLIPYTELLYKCLQAIKIMLFTLTKISKSQPCPS